MTSNAPSLFTVVSKEIKESAGVTSSGFDTVLFASGVASGPKTGRDYQILGLRIL